MTGIRELKLFLDIPTTDCDSDELLLALLEHAEAYAKSYCRRDSLNPFLEKTVIKMAAEDYGKIGAMGVDSRSFSGLSENYRTDYSESIKSALRSQRKIGVI